MRKEYDFSKLKELKNPYPDKKRSLTAKARLAPALVSDVRLQHEASPQLFISLIPPLVVETLRSRPPAPTVPESRLELKLPCTVIGKSV